MSRNFPPNPSFQCIIVMKRQGKDRIHPYQVVSWVGTTVVVTAQYVLVLGGYPRTAGIALGSGYTLNLLGMGAVWILATISDPSAPSLPSQSCLPCPPSLTFCSLCNSLVPSLSKHCSHCNRCISGFDHHCKWLNNCIGAKNYPYFAVFLLTLNLLFAQSLIFDAILLYFCVSDGNLLSFYEIFDCKNAVYVGILSILALISLVILICVLQLSLFHVWLRFKGLTTYEFILKRREMRSNSGRNAKISSEIEAGKGEEPVTMDRTQLPEGFKMKMQAILVGKKRNTWSEGGNRREEELF